MPQLVPDRNWLAGRRPRPATRLPRTAAANGRQPRDLPYHLPGRADLGREAAGCAASAPWTESGGPAGLPRRRRLHGRSAGHRIQGAGERAVGAARRVRGTVRASIARSKDQLPRCRRIVEEDVAVIARHGQPAGILVGCESEDRSQDHRFEDDPRLLQRLDGARERLRAGKGVRLEDCADGRGGTKRVELARRIGAPLGAAPAV